jgi:type IV secretion system protein VirD4
VRPEPGAPATDGLERIGIVCLACGLVLACFVDAVAGLAAVLSGHGWPSTPLADVPHILAGLPHQLADPRQAWPRTIRGALPSAPVFYGAALLVTAAAGALLTVGFRLWSRPARGARWARQRDLRRLAIGRQQPGRIVIGRYRGHLLAAEPRQSLLVVAPTQSGKTSGVAVPAILEWTGPVVAVSVKADLLSDTLVRRSAVGDVAVFDPTGSTGVAHTASWTPLLSCRDWAGARRVARWLADGASPSKRGLADGDFWYSAAAKLLAPILFAAATAGLTMDAVVTWIDTQDESAVLQALEATGCTEALQAMQANWARDERQRSSIYTTAETVLEAYADPGILDHSRRPEITADRLLSGGASTLYVCASAREQRRLRPVFVALLEEILEGAYRRAATQGAPLTPPLLVVLDEVANVAPLPDLDGLVSTAAGHGVQLVTVLQDLAQAHDRWGRERADTIVNNHRAKLLGAGLADQRSVEWVARLLGEEEVTRESTTVDRTGGRSTSRSAHRQPLLAPDGIRQARDNTALLIYGNLPPAWVQLRPWFADRRLRRLAQRDHSERSAPRPAMR